MRLQLYIVCLTTLWFMGCASSKTQQQPGNETSTFETKVIETNFSMNNDKLSKPATVYYQVRAQCEGPNCTPDEAELSFHLQPGSNKMYLSNRNLTMHVGEETYNWRGREWRNIYTSPPVVGMFKMITLEWKVLAKLAEDKNVTGNLSGQNFEWTYKNRVAIRNLLKEIDSEDSANN